MKVTRESTIRVGDFAGFVPARRGAHCRPLHPRLASFYPLRRDLFVPAKSSGETEPKDSTGNCQPRHLPLGRWPRDIHESVF
jgi:hypothetical protein